MHHGIFNYWWLNCLFNNLFGLQHWGVYGKYFGKNSISRIPGSVVETSKLHITGAPCDGNPPVTGGLPSQRASNAECVSLSWCNHICTIFFSTNYTICCSWAFTLPFTSWWPQYISNCKTHLFPGYLWELCPVSYHGNWPSCLTLLAWGRTISPGALSGHTLMSIRKCSGEQFNELHTAFNPKTAGSFLSKCTFIF